MLMHRRHAFRLTTAFFVVLSLLLSRLAMASYSCPAEPQAAAMAAMAASGMPCAGMDKAQPALCHAHSTNAPQSFESLKLPVASPPTVVQVLDVPPVLDGADAVATPFASTHEARPPPNPLFLSTLRLRV